MVQIIEVRGSNHLIRALKWVFLDISGIDRINPTTGSNNPPTPSTKENSPQKVSGYLSNTINARVGIDRIYLSMFEGIAVDQLEVEDPNGKSILKSDKIAVAPDLIDLIAGKLNISMLTLEGMEFVLIEDGQELNIQFIIDAFSSEEKVKPATSESFSIEAGSLDLKRYPVSILVYI